MGIQICSIREGKISNIVFGNIIYVQQRIKYDHHDRINPVSM